MLYIKLYLADNQGVSRPHLNREKLSLILVFVFLFSTQTNSTSSANFLSNSIEKTPALSRNLSTFLIDLSGSVDHAVVVRGFESIRQNLAYIYEGADVEKNLPAASYYRWIPIRGAEATSADLPIFTEDDDVALWAAARRVKGKANQLQVLKKIRETNGLWSRLMSSNSLNMAQCQSAAFAYLKSAGLSGLTFQRLNIDVCNTALKVRARVKQVIDNIKAYTEPKLVTLPSGNTKLTTERKTTGTDIFGTISKLENLSRNSSYLNRFKEVRLVFISDMLHHTDAVKLKKLLAAKNASEGCRLANERAGIQSGFEAARFRITIYGLGEVKERKKASTKSSEELYPVLRNFWDCFWSSKGLDIPDAEFKKLSTFEDQNERGSR